MMRIWGRVFHLCALLLSSTNAQECATAPFWLFTLPEDLEQIFSGLTGMISSTCSDAGIFLNYMYYIRFLEPLIICENGEVTALLAQRSTAATFALFSNMHEFPLTWCIAESEVSTI